MKLEIPPGDFAGYIFDLDGTLVDTMPLHYRAWDIAMRQVGLQAPLDEELFYALGGVPTRQVAELIARHYGLTIDLQAVFDHKESVFVELQKDARLIEPVVEFARRMSKTHPISIASGGPRVVVRGMLELTGLAALFPYDVVITPEDVEHGKPAPDMFLLAAKRMGVAPERCLVFEDAEPGMRAAEAAGMRWVRVPSRKKMAPAGAPPGIESRSGERRDVASLARLSVLSQPVYQPGKPIEHVARELGLEPGGIIKLASNENPFGPSPLALAAARHALEHGQLYPDGGCYELRQKLAAEFGLGADQFVVGNGSNEIIELLGHVFLSPGDEVVMGAPAFVVYKLVTLLFGAKAVEVPLREWRHDLPRIAAAITPRTKLVYVCSPNNPTGTANNEAELLAFARALPDHVMAVFDEAYADFLPQPPDLRLLIREGRKIICLRTFSKIYGLAALRIGYGYAGAEVCALLNRVRQPFNVNAIAQAAAMAALGDREFAARCARENRAGLAQLEAGCRELGLEFVPSVANFMLVKVGDGARVFDALQRRGVIVRPVASYGLPEWIRVTIGSRQQNDRFLAELRRAAC